MNMLCRSVVVLGLFCACAAAPADPIDEGGSSSTGAIEDESSDAPADDDADPRLDVHEPRTDVGTSCVEPQGERVAVADCDPCDVTQGFGAPVQDPVSWIVTRLVPPSYPYRIDTLAAAVTVDGPFEMFWFVDDVEVPPTDLAFADRIEMEVGFDELAVWELDAPITLAPGEFLFVGLTVPSGGTVYDCEQGTDDDRSLFVSPATQPAEWIRLLGTAPVVFGYGGPE
jgi:hypothetical protein